MVNSDRLDSLDVVGDSDSSKEHNTPAMAHNRAAARKALGVYPNAVQNVTVMRYMDVL